MKENENTPPVPLHFNHRYILDFVARQCRDKPEMAILDYGCGSAQTVIAGRRQGMNIYGVEVFHMGDSVRNQVAEAGLLGTTVREIKAGVLDFPDEYFDFIFSNQVLEHVRDLEQVLEEIQRVLKPGGTALHLFPSEDVWREGHCGIPFLHWFPKKSPLRFPYAFTLRSLGFGTFKDPDPRAWTLRMLNYLDNFCFYRSRRSIFAAFGKYFDITLIEDDYLRMRMGESRLRSLAPLVQWPITKPLVMETFRKLGGMVLLSTRRNPMFKTQ
jgi:SAM-dependent methyltransferase